MKIERRALLAFVASMLLFLAYDAFYLSPKMERQRERRAAEAERARLQAQDSIAAAEPIVGGEVTDQPEVVITETSSEPEPVSTESGEPERAGQTPVTEAPKVEFTVTSPLYEITLTTTGAEIVSVKLPEYTTGDLPVELVPQNPDWPYARAVSVSLSGQRLAAPLHDVSFEALKDGAGTPLLNGARIEVDERRGQTEIVFRAPDNSGGVIERYYRFFVDRYDFETGVRFASSSFPGVTGVTWGMGEGLAVTEENVKDDQQNFKATLMLGEDVHALKPSDFGKKSHEDFAGTLSWIALKSKYFTAAMIPMNQSEAK